MYRCIYGIRHSKGHGGNRQHPVYGAVSEWCDISPVQLIHEKMLLSEAKSSIFLAQLQEFKVQLEEKVSNYLAEELEAFVAGFDLINTGIASGDSDMVIQGNMQIQSVLGRQPQFTNQSEFDSLMESDMPLLL